MIEELGVCVIGSEFGKNSGEITSKFAEQV